MINIKRAAIISGLITFSPIIFGIIFYGQLPAKMAIHFGINGNADGFAPKAVTVILIPLLMLLLQLIMIFTYKFSTRYQARMLRMEWLYFSIIPVTSVVLYLVTIYYNLGNHIDIRRIVVFLVAVIFIALGNYMPTLSYEQQRVIHPLQIIRSKKLWLKANRRNGYIMFFGGFIMLVSLFLSPIISMIALLAVISCLIISSLFGLISH
ncbi:DUF1648 domain-containing protein [Lentilactobacillus sp. Marseille-Q4993]|uniref:DUF1648 domain-containing protein n=1 Tax=Lentilactobacillus sp. Marseille-Q4993 TaxID=3039492 RepID=UPI0024BCED5A|nr:DUF1648 domain-containing protein [Lentilactobacillus sp. Marseille-Q4993]